MITIWLNALWAVLIGGPVIMLLVLVYLMLTDRRSTGKTTRS
jgi:uncharacterized integral membrane protein